MILVDTSVLIGFFQKHENPPVFRFKKMIAEEIPFGITSQIYQEILQGTKTDRDYSLLKSYLETQIFFHPKDPIESYAHAAQIYQKCRKQGITLRSTIDCLIAQVAIEHNLSLLHYDKDFNKIASVIELKLY